MDPNDANDLPPIDFQEFSERLNRFEEKLDLQLADIEARTVPRQELKQRIKTAGLIAIVMSLLILTVENIGIRNCFLAPSQTGWSQQACSIQFPGYGKSRNESDARVQMFYRALKMIEEDHATIIELQRETETLKAKG